MDSKWLMGSFSTEPRERDCLSTLTSWPWSENDFRGMIWEGLSLNLITRGFRDYIFGGMFICYLRDELAGGIEDTIGGVSLLTRVLTWCWSISRCYC
jgi:hypothetical protein